MFLPFISRARFDEMLREKNSQISDRDRRISELEAERRMLWDELCLLGFGVPLFSGTPKALDSSPRCDQPKNFPENLSANAETQSQPGAPPPRHTQAPRESGTPVAVPHRPSQIMRRMDRLAEARWRRKIHPAKAAELQRDEVMNQLDAAHREAVKTVLSS